MLGINEGAYLPHYQLVTATDVNGGFIKAILFGLLVTTICCRQGYYTNKRRDSVGPEAAMPPHLPWLSPCVLIPYGRPHCYLVFALAPHADSNRQYRPWPAAHGLGSVREVSGVLQLVDCGVVQRPRRAREFSGPTGPHLPRAFWAYSPASSQKEAAIEQVFTAKNAASALKLG